MKIKNIKFTACLILLLSTVAQAQTGGDFTITQSVVASGGQNSSGGNFSLDGTIGQPLAGTNSSGGAFVAGNGFWQAAFAPTAANVSISGRILTADGTGIRNAVISLTPISGGQIRSARSSGFGFYCIEDVLIGETYILRISSKRFVFLPETQIVTPLDELTNVNFTAQQSGDNFNN